MSTCDNRQMPKQATGKTPVRNARIAEEPWMKAVARAEAEDRTASDVMNDAIVQYGNGAMLPAYEFTFANWPDAAAWVEAAPRFRDLAGELAEALGFSDPEYLAVATHLAVTHHPADIAQQKRVITGHVLRRADRVAKGGWRGRYRDSRQLSETVQAILEKHLPRLAA
jgi:hypothetical protein